MKDQLKKILSNKPFAIIFFISLGIALIMISVFTDGNCKKEASSDFDNSYGEYLESKLESTLSGLYGAGKIDAMITFENQYEILASSNTSAYFSTTDEAERIVEKPLPKIAGVMIVCNGVTSTEDFKIIKNAASTALGISKNKINIIGGKR